MASGPSPSRLLCRRHVVDGGSVAQTGQPRYNGCFPAVEDELERGTGLEPATSCLEDYRARRRAVCPRDTYCDFSMGAPASCQPLKPESKCATLVYPISFSALAASAERPPEAQWRMMRRSGLKTSR